MHGGPEGSRKHMQTHQKQAARVTTEAILEETKFTEMRL